MERHESIEISIRRCKEQQDLLGELIPIHLKIDIPERIIKADEPEWILRLRKVFRHTMSIVEYKINVDGIHRITTELRAIYRQMRVIWKYLPEGFRLKLTRIGGQRRQGTCWRHLITPHRLVYGYRFR